MSSVGLSNLIAKCRKCLPYGTESISYLDPKIWKIISNQFTKERLNVLRD